MNKVAYKSVAAVCLLAISVGSSWFAATSYVYNTPRADSTRISQQHTSPPSLQESSPEPKASRLVMVGDMLIHDTIYEDFRTKEGFDFRPAFRQIKPVISKSDFAILNQETILGGEELGLSGLYQANSPQALGKTYVDTGFNMMQLANNHANDRGKAGVKNTLEFWKQHKGKAITSGVYKKTEQPPPIPTITQNDITAAFLTYTYGSNLGDVPNPYHLNYIDRGRIRREVKRARQQADVVIVGMHWGIEKSRHPSQRQRQLARFLNKIGVDIIYGTHPHVLQPPEKIVGENGQETYIFYSLGNFLSIHIEKPPYTLTGAIAGVDIQKDPNGEVAISAPFVMPTWNYFSSEWTDFTVMPFENVHQKHFRFGNWPSHQKDTKAFLRSEFPNLKIVNSDYFKD